MAAPTVTTSYAAIATNVISLHVPNVVVGAVTNPMIVVMHNGATNAAMNGASWNGENFALIPGFSSAGFWSAAAYLVPTGTGTHDVIVTFPFFGNSGVVVSVAVLASAVGIGPAVAHQDSFGTSVGTNLTTTENDSMVIHFTMNDGNRTQTQGSGQTLIQDNLNFPYRSACAYKTVATSGTSTAMAVTSAGSSINFQMNTFEVLSQLPKSASDFFSVF